MKTVKEYRADVQRTMAGEYNDGASGLALARKYGLALQTAYRWIQLGGGKMRTSNKGGQYVRDLQEENAHLAEEVRVLRAQLAANNA